MIMVAEFQSEIARAMSRLVATSEAIGESVVVSLPIMYPSGAFAGVSISLVAEGRCFLSDTAIGLREAEMAGVADFYDSAAKHLAEHFGVGFDGASIFVASASLDRIAGAAAAVGNASTGAVARAIMKAAEYKERAKNNVLFDIVSEFFGRPNVERTIEIAGRDSVWPAHNVVSFHDRHQAVFEFVAAHTNSIANKYLMFSDLGKMESPPSLVSVVNSIDNLGSKGAMLSDVSNVIELKSARPIYERYARKAA
jgi:hypothetical protein